MTITLTPTDAEADVIASVLASPVPLTLEDPRRHTVESLCDRLFDEKARSRTPVEVDPIVLEAISALILVAESDPTQPRIVEETIRGPLEDSIIDNFSALWRRPIARPPE